MDYKISIIVPVYNVENYVEKCLYSLIHQTYPNIEVIVVDDGSTDNSLAVVKQIATTDSRILVLEKENGGLSSARNFGLQKTSGDYIVFVDSDDWLELDCIDYLVNKLNVKKYDIIEFGYQLVTSTNHIISVYKYNEREITKKEDVLDEYFFGNSIPDIVCNKIYNSKLFKNTKFVEGKIHEDYMITPELLNHCNHFLMIDKVFYNYFQRGESITNRKFTKKNLDKLYAGQYVVDYCSKENINFVNAAKIRYAFACIFLYKHLMDSSVAKREKKIYKKIINNEYKKLYFSIKDSATLKKIPIIKRCFLIMFNINKNITCVIYKILRR